MKQTMRANFSRFCGKSIELGTYIFITIHVQALLKSYLLICLTEDVPQNERTQEGW